MSSSGNPSRTIKLKKSLGNIKDAVKDGASDFVDNTTMTFASPQAMKAKTARRLDSFKTVVDREIDPALKNNHLSQHDQISNRVANVDPATNRELYKSAYSQTGKARRQLKRSSEEARANRAAAPPSNFLHQPQSQAPYQATPIMSYEEMRTIDRCVIFVHSVAHTQTILNCKGAFRLSSTGYGGSPNQPPPPGQGYYPNPQQPPGQGYYPNPQHQGYYPNPQPSPGQGYYPNPQPSPGQGYYPNPQPSPGQGYYPNQQPTPGHGGHPQTDFGVPVQGHKPSPSASTFGPGYSG
ncbi:hypothetical protein C8R46DRAFT_1197981 [Mycena filopes]|nr:hypothetical protein C8R46DRAFT_1197981 [Mycena filopes]